MWQVVMIYIKAHQDNSLFNEDKISLSIRLTVKKNTSIGNNYHVRYHHCQSVPLVHYIMFPLRFLYISLQVCLLVCIVFEFSQFVIFNSRVYITGASLVLLVTGSKADSLPYSLRILLDHHMHFSLCLLCHQCPLYLISLISFPS